MDPLPRASEFRNDKTPVILGSNVNSSCVRRDDRPGGITDQMTWAIICFSGSEPLVESVLDFTYSMEYRDYRPFKDKQIARTYVHNDDNTHVVGKLTSLDDLNKPDESLFRIDHPTSPADRIETQFVSMATNESLLEKAPEIQWPKIAEGKTEGNMIVHVLTDRSGQVREAYRHNSDTPALEDFGRLQALKFKFKPLLANGVAQQMETPLVLHFKTEIGDTLPVVTGKDIQTYATGCHYKPVLPRGLLPGGTTFKIRVSVNEEGKLTGETFPEGIPWTVIQKAGLEPHECVFKPYLINGQSWYHHLDFVFTAP